MTHCINVYKGLRYTNSGDVQFCCKSDMFLDDKDGNKAQIYTHTLEEAQNGNLAVEIREDLERGVKHKNCQKCWDEEEAGISSKRILDNQRAIRYWGERYLNDKVVSPEIVEFNFGTICNLKCRICGPWSSSRWNSEFYELLAGEDYPKEHHDNQVSLWQGNWEDDSPAWDNISKSIGNLRHIDFYGGEPFLVDRNWEILKQNVENGNSSNQYIHFNTNGTRYEEEHIEILKSYRRINISLSIDDMGERFNYQRHPANWDIVNENLKKFKELEEEFPQFEVMVCVTVNNLNLWYIPELVNYFDSMGIPYYINYLHYPSHYNISNLKQDVKPLVAQKYDEAMMEMQCNYSKDNLKAIINYMNVNIGTAERWNEFLNKTEFSDKYRKQNFKSVFPEWADVLGIV
jgi:MoaA/NifB/PqqE/SkfB family radical SAM enzyme